MLAQREIRDNVVLASETPAQKEISDKTLVLPAIRPHKRESTDEAFPQSMRTASISRELSGAGTCLVCISPRQAREGIRRWHTHGRCDVMYLYAFIQNVGLASEAICPHKRESIDETFASSPRPCEHPRSQGSSPVQALAWFASHHGKRERVYEGDAGIDDVM